jgi:hypothetical protein
MKTFLYEIDLDDFLLRAGDVHMCLLACKIA